MTAPLLLAALLTCTGPIAAVRDADTVVIACDHGADLVLRLANVDAPETGRPRCARERVMGDAARELVRAAFTGAPVTVTAPYTDLYGRAVGDAAILGGPWAGWGLTGAITAAAARADVQALGPWPHDATGNALAPKPDWCAP